jgi:probable HAF family extracellular repeat protein
MKESTSFRFVISVSVGLSISLCAQNALSLPGFEVYDLGLDTSNNSVAYAINDYGQVVGRAGAGTAGYAYLYDNGELTNIGLTGGGLGATDINNSGTVVGYSSHVNLNDNLLNGAFVWEGDQMNALGMLPSGRYSYARGINETGTIVGGSELVYENISYYHAVQWENGAINDLGTLENQSLFINSSQANAINDNGIIAGYSFGSSDDYDLGVYPVVWENRIIQKLVTLGNGGQAHDINNTGQIVGSMSYPFDGGTTYDHASLWQDGSAVDLGTLQEGIYSTAYGINEGGVIVGQSTLTASRSDQNYHAALWVDDAILDLNELIDPSLGWTVTSAQDINENYQIVGQGYIDGEYRGFLLDPEWDAVVTTNQTYLSDQLVLDETFSFDFWWEMGTEPTSSNTDVLSVFFFNGTNWEIYGWELNLLRGSSTNWASTSFWVPEWARGKNTQIMFSLTDGGQEVTNPTVYLRNIASTSAPEPATILLLSTGLLALAGARFRRKEK